MEAIHFVEKLGNYRVVSEETGEWESGYWNVTVDAAAQLVGGDIFLHPGQLKPSTIGGKITGFRIATEKNSDRIIFRFQKLDSHEGVVTEKEGWGNEQKRVQSSE
ncbi:MULTISPECIES: hypothetical protein [Shewanella]|nr:hypothetical protein [Shewanella algae]EKT4489506.1 hypothetical protein [Shewanella algae]MBO2546201.1 hypothetical protein [Shewanella algae]TVL55359.1 hypothetical protein AYJ00_04785 [Shewanella algae]HDS1199526.1 hypothetical protein [Shewanella algae]